MSAKFPSGGGAGPFLARSLHVYYFSITFLGNFVSLTKFVSLKEYTTGKSFDHVVIRLIRHVALIYLELKSIT